MSIEIFKTTEVQDFLRLASGLDQPGGNPRTKQVIHRILSDLYKAIEDLNVTSDEYWAGIAYLNQLGARGEAGLLSPGLGLDRFQRHPSLPQPGQAGVPQLVAAAVSQPSPVPR